MYELWYQVQHTDRTPWEIFLAHTAVNNLWTLNHPKMPQNLYWVITSPVGQTEQCWKENLTNHSGQYSKSEGKPRIREENKPIVGFHQGLPLHHACTCQHLALPFVNFPLVNKREEETYHRREGKVMLGHNSLSSHSLEEINDNQINTYIF